MNPQFNPRSDAVIQTNPYTEAIRWVATGNGRELCSTARRSCASGANSGPSTCWRRQNRWTPPSNVHECIGRLLAGLVVQGSDHGRRRPKGKNDEMSGGVWDVCRRRCGRSRSGTRAVADRAGRRPPAQCSAPLEAKRPRTRAGQFPRAHRAAGKPLKIVAIGSSSTAGAGASSSAATYPSRLEAELKKRSSRPANHGSQKRHGRRRSPANGGALRRRRDRRSSPILCCGRSAATRCCAIIRPPAQVIRQGVERLKSSGADVVLINPQYAPKIFAKPDVEQWLTLSRRPRKRSERRPVPSLRRDALLAQTDDMPFEHVHLAGRPAHERLGLWLRRQAAGGRDRRASSRRPRLPPPALAAPR